MGEPIQGCGSCVLDLASLRPFSVGVGPRHAELSPIVKRGQLEFPEIEFIRE